MVFFHGTKNQHLNILIGVLCLLRCVCVYVYVCVCVCVCVRVRMHLCVY